jgi:hypothetical protein
MVRFIIIYHNDEHIDILHCMLMNVILSHEVNLSKIHANYTGFTSFPRFIYIIIFVTILLNYIITG